MLYELERYEYDLLSMHLEAAIIKNFLGNYGILCIIIVR